MQLLRAKHGAQIGTQEERGEELPGAPTMDDLALVVGSEDANAEAAVVGI